MSLNYLISPILEPFLQDLQSRTLASEKPTGSKGPKSLLHFGHLVLIYFACVSFWLDVDIKDALNIEEIDDLEVLSLFYCFYLKHNIHFPSKLKFASFALLIQGQSSAHEMQSLLPPYGIGSRHPSHIEV